MHDFTLALHSLLRWMVLLLGLVAAARALRGWTGGGEWSAADDRSGRLFVIAFDVQVLIGLLLYTWLSPITTTALQNMGAAMQNSLVRFWVVEHIFGMILGLALAHIGRAKLRRAADPVARHRRAAIYFGLAWLLAMLSTPWPFMAYGRPLWPW